MDSSKRTWIYAGLVVVAGVGLVTVASRRGNSSSFPPPNGGGPPGPPPPQPTVFRPMMKGDRLLLIGDSLAQGLTAPMKQLASDTGVAFLGDGRVSTRINQWSSQPWLATDLNASKPSVVVVSLGTNDMKLSDPNSEKSALASLLKTLNATGSTLVWIAPPTMPFPDQGVRAMIDQAIVQAQASLFHSEMLTIPRGPDNIHPTTLGYAGWAGALWQFLLRGGLSVVRNRVGS